LLLVTWRAHPSYTQKYSDMIVLCQAKPAASSSRSQD